MTDDRALRLAEKIATVLGLSETEGSSWRRSWQDFAKLLVVVADPGGVLIGLDSDGRSFHPHPRLVIGVNRDFAHGACENRDDGDLWARHWMIGHGDIETLDGLTPEHRRICRLIDSATDGVLRYGLQNFGDVAFLEWLRREEEEAA